MKPSDLLLAATLAAAVATTFPKVTGKNLDGKTFNLPGDFEAPVSLVFVAFDRKQQDDVDSWHPFAADLTARFAHLKVYELPTLSKSYSLVRGFIDGGMRSGIPDPAVRAATITLYIDKKPFEDALGITTEGAIVLLLVKPDGTILWRTAGRYDPAHKPDIDQYLAPDK